MFDAFVFFKFDDRHNTIPDALKIDGVGLPKLALRSCPLTCWLHVRMASEIWNHTWARQPLPFWNISRPWLAQSARLSTNRWKRLTEIFTWANGRRKIFCRYKSKTGSTRDILCRRNSTLLRQRRVKPADFVGFRFSAESFGFLSRFWNPERGRPLHWMY